LWNLYGEWFAVGYLHRALDWWLWFWLANESGAGFPHEGR